MGKFSEQLEEKFILPDDSLFVGSRTANSSRVFVKNKNGITELPLCLELVNHSPTGFSWGYAGSGPAQLAVALLRFVSQSNKVAVALHQQFKRDVVSRFGKDWAMHEWQIRNWILDHFKPEDDTADGPPV